MKARPILFSGPMITALINGAKTQTRRVITHHNSTVDGGRSKTLWNRLNWKNHENFSDSSFSDKGMPWYLHVYHSDGDTRHRVRPVYEQGDLLWVREGFAYYGMKADQVFYRATDSGSLNWRPSIHMPRWASRLTLELADVRVERLQEISREDALAEGVTGGCGPGYDFACHSYMLLWNSIHGAGAWAENPFVWVLNFRVHHSNVDKFIKQKTT